MRYINYIRSTEKYERMHRRTFNDPEEEAPPPVTRVELAELLDCLVERASHEPVQLVVGARGFGVTWLLRETKSNLESDAGLRTTAASVVAALDLARNGSCAPVQLLVQCRNEIIKGLDQRFGISDAEFWFLAFDIVAGVAWRRRRDGPLEPAFYRSSARRKLGAIGRMGKALAMGELLEACGELLGLDELSEKFGLSEYIEKGAAYLSDAAVDKILDSAEKRLQEIADGKAIAELKRKNAGTAHDLEQYLPLFLCDAIRSAFKAQYKADGRIVSGRGKKGSAKELTVIIDAADAYDAPSALGATVRRFLSVIAHDLVEAGFASIAFGGRSGAERVSLPGWRQSLGAQVGIHEVRLREFQRREVADCLERETEFNGERISRLLHAVADESDGAPVHPSAYAESYRLADMLPKASIVDAARRVLWAAGPGPFARDDLLKYTRCIISGKNCDDIVEALWKSQLWTRPYGHERRQPTWHVIASMELAASQADADPVT